MRKTSMGGLMLALVLAGRGGNAVDRAAPPGRLPKGYPPLKQNVPVAEAAVCENHFGFDLFRAAADPKHNSAMSPNSIAAVLGMIAAGANGPTQQQLLDALHVHGTQATQVSEAFGSLVRELQTRNREGMRFTEADRAWVDKELKLLASYTDTLTRHYDAPFGTLDFGDREGSAAAINTWVAEQTHGKITKLVTPDALDLAQLVLTNAVYLDAKWEHPFEHFDTMPRPFHRGDGSTVSVPTMKQRQEFASASGAGWRAIALPYKGGKVEMDVIVPDDLAAFEGTLGGAQLDTIVHSLQPREVDLLLPKFSLRSRYENLADAMARLGVTDAFDHERADFSGMTGDHSLWLGAVVHEAYVAVDEAGTVAAAATGGVMRAVSMPAPAPEFRVDKPFVFMVRDTVTGAVLFEGHVVDPSQTA
jgi:serpin B